MPASPSSGKERVPSRRLIARRVVLGAAATFGLLILSVFGYWQWLTRDLAVISRNTPSVLLCMAVSPDGTTVAAGDLDGKVKVWNTGDWSLRHTVQAHASPVVSLDFSHDSSLLATGSYDHTASVWDSATGGFIRRFEHPEWVFDVAFSPDSSNLGTAGGLEAGQVTVWNVSNGDVVLELKRKYRVETFTFAPDGQSFFIHAELEPVEQIELSSGKQLCQYEGTESGPIGELTCAPDGKHIAMTRSWISGRNYEWGSSLYEIAGERVADFPDCPRFTFSPDGKLLIGSTGTTRSVSGMIESMLWGRVPAQPCMT